MKAKPFHLPRLNLHCCATTSLANLTCFKRAINTLQNLTSAASFTKNRHPSLPPCPQYKVVFDFLLRRYPQWEARSTLCWGEGGGNLVSERVERHGKQKQVNSAWPSEPKELPPPRELRPQLLLPEEQRPQQAELLLPEEQCCRPLRKRERGLLHWTSWCARGES